MSEIRPLRKCNPATRSPTSDASAALYTVSGEHLYAALPTRCLTGRSAPPATVVDVDLRSRRSHVLARVPGTFGYIAASGKYVAVTYSRSPPRSIARTSPNTLAREPQLLVRVLDAATGAVVNQVTPPRSAQAFVRNGASGVQVDNSGDVLVSAGCCGASPGELAHVAQPRRISAWWWAKAGSAVGRETRLGSGAVLSDGRVAFFSSEADNRGAETIEVKDLRSGAAKTIVTFSGSLGAHSLALSGNSLAWAQQSTVISVVRGPAPGGGSFEECKTVPLTPVELASLDLRHAPSAPVLLNGVPIPPQYANELPCLVR